MEEVLEVVAGNARFLPRYQLEDDPSMKQIIPYLIFTQNGRYFLMRRTAHHTDQRLANLFSLGIGGHIRKDEFAGQNVFEWAKREFAEEVVYSGDFKVNTLGLINDDTSPVHAVHTGFVLLLEGDSPEISVKEEHKEGRLATLQECEQVYDQMENWSKIVFDSLRK